MNIIFHSSNKDVNTGLLFFKFSTRIVFILREKPSRSQKLSVYSCVIFRLQRVMIQLRNSVPKYYQAERGCTPGFNHSRLTHCGETCSPVIQVKVNAAEGQTCVFISIILHNNTVFFFFFGKEQKRENRCNKRSPSGMRPYLEKCLFINRD